MTSRIFVTKPHRVRSQQQARRHARQRTIRICFKMLFINRSNLLLLLFGISNVCFTRATASGEAARSGSLARTPSGASTVISPRRRWGRLSRPKRTFARFSKSRRWRDVKIFFLRRTNERTNEQTTTSSTTSSTTTSPPTPERERTLRLLHVFVSNTRDAPRTRAPFFFSHPSRAARRANIDITITPRPRAGSICPGR